MVCMEPPTGLKETLMKMKGGKFKSELKEEAMQMIQSL